jgi:hypothetical protein
MDQTSLLHSSTKSRINCILPSRNLRGVLPWTSSLTIDFKKPPFKLEEQGWGEFDMLVTLHFAEKGGSKDLAHDLHFQSAKYETTHVVVSFLLFHWQYRTLPNPPQVFLNSWQNQARRQDSPLRLQHLLSHPHPKNPKNANSTPPTTIDKPKRRALVKAKIGLESRQIWTD